MIPSTLTFKTSLVILSLLAVLHGVFGNDGRLRASEVVVIDAAKVFERSYAQCDAHDVPSSIADNRAGKGMEAMFRFERPMGVPTQGMIKSLRVRAVAAKTMVTPRTSSRWRQARRNRSQATGMRELRL